METVQKATPHQKFRLSAREDRLLQKSVFAGNLERGGEGGHYPPPYSGSKMRFREEEETKPVHPLVPCLVNGQYSELEKFEISVAYAIRLSAFILLFAPSSRPEDSGWSYQFRMSNVYAAMVLPIFIKGQMPDFLALSTQSSITFLSAFPARLFPELSQVFFHIISSGKRRIKFQCFFKPCLPTMSGRQVGWICHPPPPSTQNPDEPRNV